MMLPNIMFVNKQIHEELQSLILKDAVYVVDFNSTMTYILLAQYENSIRGLRANKAMDESLACLRRIAKFKKVILRVLVPGRRTYRQHLVEAILLIFEFLQKNGPPNMTISFDLFGVFSQYRYYESARILKIVRSFLDRGPRYMLEVLTSRRANRQWPQRIADTITDLYTTTNQTMLKAGETLLIGGWYY